MSARDIIDRLSHVRSVGSSRWMARCPAHEDSSPSLKVTELDDGRVLVFCHAGCGALDVLDSLGLEWSALFPPEEKNYHSLHRKTMAKEGPESEEYWDLVIEMYEADCAAGKRIKPENLELAMEAYERTRHA